MDKEVINGKVVKRWFSRGKARIPIFEDGTIGIDRYTTQGVEDREKLKGETREQRQKWENAFRYGHTREYYENIRDKHLKDALNATNDREREYSISQYKAWDKELVATAEQEDTFNGIYDYPTEVKDASHMVDYNAKTRQGRYANYATVDVAKQEQANRLREVGRSAKARAIDEVNGKEYKSVVDRYNKDEKFREMLKKEHDKGIETTKKEISSYFDMTLEDRQNLVGEKEDLYKAINEDYGNIDKEDFNRLYNEEMQRRVATNTAGMFGAREVKVNGETIKLGNNYDKDIYQSKVFGTDVTKMDKQMKDLFGKDFKYDEEKDTKRSTEEQTIPREKANEFVNAFKTALEEEQNGYTQTVDWDGGTYEYSKDRLERMEQSGIKPLEHSYTGGGWQGTKYDSKLTTKEIAKTVQNELKKDFPDVKISRKTDYNSIDINIMSSEKDLYTSSSDIDRMSDKQVSDTIRDSIGGYTRMDDWLEKNNRKSANGTFTANDERDYLKEELETYRNRTGYRVSGDEWYLSDYGKKVVGSLNKNLNSYNYDDSDGMVDYFDTNFYGGVQIGKWDKPYVVENKKIEAKVERFKKRKNK